MIPQAEGKALIETLEGNGPEQGALVPMNCKKDSGIGDKNQQCHAAVKADRELVEGLVLVSVGERAVQDVMKLAVAFHETSERRTRSRLHSYPPSLEDFCVSGTARRPRVDQQLTDCLAVAKKT